MVGEHSFIPRSRTCHAILHSVTQSCAKSAQPFGSVMGGVPGFVRKSVLYKAKNALENVELKHVDVFGFALFRYRSLWRPKDKTKMENIRTLTKNSQD